MRNPKPTTKTGAEKRRADLLAAIANAEEPQSAGSLGEKFGVSRQVIVQDVALLRAEGNPVVSTNRGYILAGKKLFSRVFKVHHTEAELEEELDLIVDRGGTVRNVFVNHRVYGRIEAELNIENRVHAAEFVRSIESGSSKPLMLVTEGYHYHTVSAPDEKTLDEIGVALKERGFLLER